MSEWKNVKLGELLQIKKGDYITRKDARDGIYPVILGGREPAYYIDKFNHTGKAIVISRSGASAGFVSFWNEPIFVTDGFLIEPKEKITYEFLYYALKSKQSLLHNAQKGAAIPHVTPLLISDIDFLLPDENSQHRIASILSRYDSLIENYQKQIKLLEEAAQRLYKEWFVDLHFPSHENTKIVDGVPEGWEKKRLIDLVDVQYGYAFDGKLFNSNKEGTPIVRIRNIPDGYTSDYTTEEASADYIVKSGDILVGMDGIFHINSWSGEDAYLVQRACSFRPKEECMKGFIFQAIQEPIKFFEKTLVGATVAHLGKKHIDSIDLLYPNNEKLFIPLQRMFDKRQLALSQIRLLTEARDRLLPKLISGKIQIKNI